MGQKKDRREYFKSYYKNMSDEKKEELRNKKKEAYKRKKLANVLDAEVSSSTKITFGERVRSKSKESLQRDDRHASRKRKLLNVLNRKTKCRTSILTKDKANEVEHIPSRISNKGKEQIEFYSTYEVGSTSKPVRRSASSKTQNQDSRD